MRIIEITDFAMIWWQPNIKTRREKYSAFAIFKNQQEANLAFENINENQDKVRPDDT